MTKPVVRIHERKIMLKDKGEEAIEIDSHVQYGPYYYAIDEDFDAKDVNISWDLENLKDE